MAAIACDSQLVLGRFTRLMQDVMRGGSGRTCFEAWEVDLLLDIAACDLDRKRARDVLRRYQKAAEKRLDYGVLPPLKLSEYLKLNRASSG